VIPRKNLAWDHYNDGLPLVHGLTEKKSATWQPLVLPHHHDMFHPLCVTHTPIQMLTSSVLILMQQYICWLIPANWAMLTKTLTANIFWSVTSFDESFTLLEIFTSALHDDANFIEFCGLWIFPFLFLLRPFWASWGAFANYKLSLDFYRSFFGSIWDWKIQRFICLRIITS